jgi:hypothetical protein
VFCGEGLALLLRENNLGSGYNSTDLQWYKGAMFIIAYFQF